MATCKELFLDQGRLKALLQHVHDDNARQDILDQLSDVETQIQAQGCVQPVPPPPPQPMPPPKPDKPQHPAVPFRLFRPEIEGFGFHNTWFLDDFERGKIHELFQAGIGPAVAALGPLLTPAATALDLFGSLLGIPPGTLETIGLVAAITGKLNDVVDLAAQGPANNPHPYGLCGGMAFSALDYYKAGLLIQRGGHDDEHNLGGQPQRTTREGTILRDYIWQRLIDSFVLGGAQTTLEWMAILHFVPRELSGGGPELRNRSRKEWDKLKQHLDNGEPWPLGLIGTSLNPMENHQVLAIGYDDYGNNTGRMYLYDSNCPAGYPTSLDGISDTYVDFNQDELWVVESCKSSERGSLKGFFCENYQPNPSPPIAVGISQGLTPSPAGVLAEGQNVMMTYTATNVGFGATPPLKLFVHGVRRYPVDGGSIPFAKPVGDGGPDGNGGPPFKTQEVDFTSPGEQTAPLDSGASRQLTAGLDSIAFGTWSFSAAARLQAQDGTNIDKSIPPLPGASVLGPIVVR